MDGSDAAGLTFQHETYEQVIDDIKPLLTKHWQEIARNKDKIPLNPDYSVYTALGRGKHLRIYTARLNGVLVGYAIYFVRQHPHYQNSIWAVSDIFWLDGNVRGLGLGRGLFQFTEESLRAEGVAVMHTTYKVEHPAAGNLLESMGHELIEHGRAKMLLGD